MLAQMLLRRGQALLRSAKPSFAGTGLLERLRSTAVALLGVTAAMALGLVALAVQQDWPLLPAAPIPGLPGPAEVGDARVAAERPDPASSRTTVPEPGGETALRPGGGTASPAPQPSQVSGSHQLATAPPQPAAAQPTTDSPSTQGTVPAAPASAAQPPSAPSPAPPSNPAPAASTPVAAPPSIPEPVAVSGPDDEDEGGGEDDDAKDRGKPYGKYKPHGGWKGNKPPKDDDSDADVVVTAPPPPPPPPTTSVPEETADEYATGGAGYEAPSTRGKGRGHGFGRFGR